MQQVQRFVCSVAEGSGRLPWHLSQEQTGGWVACDKACRWEGTPSLPPPWTLGVGVSLNFSLPFPWISFSPGCLAIVEAS